MAARPDSEYNRKRNFDITSEPPEDKPGRKRKGKNSALRFVIQKHDARRLHYDFRLELDGTLKSWAVPKGPSLDPKDKRLAVHVEDHPISYAAFEGTIPKGQYGAGDVIVWDQGIWQPLSDPAKAYADGKLKFTLTGEKLTGDWTLVRTRLKASGDKEQWLLIKEKDGEARSSADYDIVEEQPASVISGRTVGKPSTKSAPSAKAQSGKTRQAKSPSKPASRSSASKSGNLHTAIPEQLSPQLATLAEQPPGGQWLYEVKFDGYRVMARVADGKVRLFTRNGHDWTEKMASQAEAIAGLGLENSWLDGEMVVLNEQGLPDFQALQNAFETNRSQHIVYYLFDAPFLNGEDLRSRPLEERRELLEAALDAHEDDTLRFSAAFDADHRSIVDSACAMSLEGVIGKRAGSTYVSRRSQDWIKLKCRRRQEFIIVGFTKPQGSRAGFGALLLGVNDKQHGLIHAGRVGTGFSHAALKELHATLQKIERKGSPLDKPATAAQSRGVHWVKPELVCEVEFAEWTRDGHIRHATFIALRSDKPPAQIVREEPQSIDSLGKKAKPKSSSAGSTSSGSGRRKGRETVAGVSISNPDRVIDKQGGWTKKDLAEFYDDIADWILPELDNRPVSLLRAPEGADGEQFFQKHAVRLAIPNIKHLDKSLDPGHDRLMEINSLKALVGAVQMGTIELHTWGANSSRIETPDRFVLDLDPDPALPWRTMIEATQLTLSILDEIGLESWLKVSGGKGLHITVPLARHADWETVKHFSKAIAQFAAKMLPERFTAVMGPKNRIGKIFIDYLRNQRGASIVTAYSVRARPGLPVSVPIHRDELADLRSAQEWHIGNLSQRLNSLSQDPWEGYANRQRITKKMWQQLDAKPPSGK